MARISGVDLPRDKAVLYALPYLYGIGRRNAAEICKRAGVDPTVKVRELSDQDVAKLREIIDNDYQVEGDLRQEVQQNIRRLIEIGCYRGLRHRRGLPVRGQNTRTNSRTRKGPKKTVAGKKKATK
ncbi:30S ribosomal protein S13 [Fimbriimonadia bacterium ATM]|nr:MAG: 30S ribosomal protein S13 [Armatimonadota bacterium]MBC6968672.1 30S ribosomal protein S13 [Armatimonadota bacterium]MCE7898489.1 30S ribosomal protein S13 [Armatimonadetes bacterium ATM1]MDL1928218.1 30S ribosomal protein S13 [Fimbriimonadia bacterium ATM]RIJ98224.1 MAG: 30S ribosomal protein S13 [Armatimonadota bacterium]